VTGRDARPELRIVVNDFGGYPFPVELSEELAARGHAVTHCWCASLVDTPASARGFADRPAARGRLDLVPLDLGESLDKYHYVKRLRQEQRYGRLAAELVKTVTPDVVVAANVPLDAQKRLVDTTRRLDIPFVFWLQDLIGPATENLLHQRLPVLGRLLGRHYTRLEGRLLRRSSAVVSITHDFDRYLAEQGVDSARVTTVPNWAPLAGLPVRARGSAWAIGQGLADRFVFAYTGALGMKQDPDLIVALAERYRDRDDVVVVVHSGGPGLEYLGARRRTLDLPNLLVRDFVQWNELPDVLGAADVLLATIHAGAGSYSVPSKVMSYLCAGRPLLVSVPEENLAGKIVREAQAGLVAGPGDRDAFLAAAERLLASAEDRARMGANARRYAESTFAIGPIADRFEGVLGHAVDLGVEGAP